MLNSASLLFFAHLLQGLLWNDINQKLLRGDLAMSIFKKKKEKIEIIVPLENNVSAREFARVHAEPNTSIEVEVHGVCGSLTDVIWSV